MVQREKREGEEEGGKKRKEEEFKEREVNRRGDKEKEGRTDRDVYSRYQKRMQDLL